MGRGTPGVCRKRRVVGEGQNQLCGMGVESQAEKAKGLESRNQWAGGG